MGFEKTEKVDLSIIHEDIVEKVRSDMADEEDIYEVSELFRAFGDSTRARIICALMESEMCVCDLSFLLGSSQSAISHQLRILKSGRLVKSRRSGKIIYYSLDDEHIRELFKLAFTHVMEE